MTERRKFLRFDTAMNAICDIVNRKIRSSYKVRNISKEGALLAMNTPLDQGEEIKLSMDVPGDNVPIFATCKVVWQKERANIEDYDTGVRFTNINSLDKGRLLEFIYTQWLKILEHK